MKNKKMLLPTIIITASIVAIFMFIIFTGIAKKPVITESEFPFSITYEYKGETTVIEDVYKAYFKRVDGYSDSKGRYYEGTIIGNEENQNAYILLQNENEQLVLHTNLDAGYLMGDSTAHSIDEPVKPQVLYYDADGMEHTDQQTLSAHQIKIISWEYPEPVKNEFIFSHISRLNGDRTIIPILISVLSILACLIFVKRDKEFKHTPLDIATITLNFIIGIGCMLLFVVMAVMIDITGCNSNVFHQMWHYLPMITALSIAASISLRRNKIKKSGFFVQFLGPVIFVVLLFEDTISMIF